MTKKILYKWIKVLEKHNRRNKVMLVNKELSKDNYIMLNNLIHSKYKQVIKEYHQTI